MSNEVKIMCSIITVAVGMGPTLKCFRTKVNFQDVAFQIHHMVNALVWKTRVKPRLPSRSRYFFFLNYL